MNYIQYGTKANATEIEAFLNHVHLRVQVLNIIEITMRSGPPMAP